MKYSKKEILAFFIYGFILIVIFVFFIWCGRLSSIRSFLIKTESNLFDIRQSIVSGYKTPNADIVILDVDDLTYEYIMNNYGYWPVPRDIWAKVTDGIFKANAKYLIYDMLFLKPNLVNKEADKKFVNSVARHNNVYLSMSFDNYSEKIRKPPVIQNSLKLFVNKGYLDDNEFITYTNARIVMDDLSKVTRNIGATNVTRDEDGIIRNITPVFKYKDDYYPNLSLLPALDMFGKRQISIVNNNIVIDENHKIPLDFDNRAIINWYGKGGTFRHISLWETIDAIENDNNTFLKNNFENKIVFVGTSTTSLSDVKSVPLEKNLAGVEIYANFLNNILDNNFIKKTPPIFDLFITMFLSMIVGYCILKMHSVIKTFIFFVLILISYTIISCVLMAKFNIWISLTVPYMAVVVTFITVYCEKYLLKVKDYEHTYKLAVTDGLTQLYNHRYFQEQMIKFTDEFLKTERTFSLLLIDIDFFKKFNDTYGHQSGDIVLREVAGILKRNSRATDIVSRYGGEEMTIILPGASNEVAVVVAQKICDAVGNYDFILAKGEKVKVTVSIGVATVGINGKQAQEIISYSDKCLYKAKELGRNQVVSMV